MVAPVTGPYSENISFWGYQRYRSWYRQRRPYSLPLGFSASQGHAHLQVNLPADSAFKYRLRTIDFVDRYYDRLYAKAYSRLVDQLEDPASLGITFVQWKEADMMIRKRANQLAAFTSSLNRFDPFGVAASLGIRLRDVRRIMKARYGASRKLSDLWLEFWFGWKPMVSDIYTACEVFEALPPWRPIKGVAKTTVPLTVEQEGGPVWAPRLMLGGTAGVKIGCRVRLVNPNLRLLRNFGLLNPAEIAFDAVPWSFVLGWFSNVSTVLSSLTDFAGLETSDGYITKWGNTSGEELWLGSDSGLYPPTYGAGTGYYVNRSVVTTIPKPRFIWAWNDIKPTRGLTAISLLIQKLPKT